MITELPYVLRIPLPNGYPATTTRLLAHIGGDNTLLFIYWAPRDCRLDWTMHVSMALAQPMTPSPAHQSRQRGYESSSRDARDA